MQSWITIVISGYLSSVKCKYFVLLQKKKTLFYIFLCKLLHIFSVQKIKNSIYLK